MKRFLPIVAVLGFLLVGCATTKHSPTYDYRFVHGPSLEAVQQQIDELAKEGWRVRSFGLGDNGHYKYVILEKKN